MIGVYRITNTETGVVYIGSSRNVLNRFRDHKKDLRAGNHKNLHLQNSWNKYGEAVFLFELIAECAIHCLAEQEQEVMDSYFAIGENLYNRKPSCHSRVGMEVSEETRLRMSVANTGKARTEQQRLNISRSLLGRKLSNEHKRKIIACRIGKPLSDSHRAALRAVSLGRVISPEQRLKISKTMKGRKQPAPITEKIRAANTGKKRSYEYKMRMSKMMKGRIISTETRKKMSLAKLGRTLSGAHKEKIRQSIKLAYANGFRKTNG